VAADSDQLFPRVTISVLPDDVLLETFTYVARPQAKTYFNVEGPRHYEDGWRTLVHVCKRWRSVVFSSPRRLDLRLFCTNRRPVKKSLDNWPALPIYIYAYQHAQPLPLRGVSNILAALKPHNRVCGIRIDGVPNSLLKRSATMKSFPALTELLLSSNDEKAPVLPDSFLGGSAPRLRTLSLTGIPFLGLGKLLLSTANLVRLSLSKISHSGYISPEAMVVSLSTLTKLEVLDLRFRSPRSRAVRENRHPLPLTRVVLPTLTWLQFRGDSEYLEDIVSRIDAPLLDNMNIIFFNQLVFNTPQLRRLISHTGKFKAPDCASIQFDDDDVTISLFDRLCLRISCKPSDWQLSSLVRLYNSALSPLPTLESLVIRNHRKYWQDDTENIQWLELLYLFSSVKDLALFGDLFRLVAPALDGLAQENVAEVLPVLQNIFLEGPQSSEMIRKISRNFVAARQLLGCPVTVHHR
jgi:hypothetical protein